MPQPASIELSRTGCFGTCPAYRLKIDSAGNVEFTGRLFVCSRGLQTARIDPVAAANLMADLDAAGYFDIHWTRGSLVTDMPSAAMRLTIGSRMRQVCHYHGDDGAPRILYSMEDAIDEVAGTKRWLPSDQDGRPVCIDATGTKHALSEYEESRAEN